MSHEYQDLYQSVTDKIIAALEAGTPPWICPWERTYGHFIPMNLSTSRPYRGINTILLNMQAVTRGYSINRWLTFQQALTYGACVRKGERGTGIVFFKMLEREGAREGAPELQASADSQRRVFPLLRSFTVFNVAQIDGLPPSALPELRPKYEYEGCKAAEQILADSKADIRHGGESAFYRPSEDYIQLPVWSSFPTSRGYCQTAMHELTHWTGHPSRCNRQLASRLHIESYAMEELVAEMGSAFLSDYCGLQGKMQHASYIATWLKALRNDKRLIFTAASLAQKAADFLLPSQQPVAQEMPVKLAVAA
jgi:antirestriction protein ArdC